jgi:WD40 repeat protein
VYEIQWSPCLDLLTPPQEEPHTENLGSADFSADGTLAVVIDEEASRMWDFTSGRLVHRMPKQAGQWLSTLFSPDGGKLWVCGWAHELTEHRITRDTSGQVTVGTASKPMFGPGNLLRDVTADGRSLVLSNNGGGQFIVASLATGELRRLKHPGTLATAISPDGTWVVTSSYQQPGVRIWSLPDGKLQRKLCENVTVMQTVITPDGQRLILQTSGLNRVFHTRDWSEAPAMPAKTRLTCMTISPDGRLIATIGDNAILLLHADTFTEAFRLILPAHIGWIGEAHPVFDGDASHLLIHTALGSVVRWNLKAMEAELVKLGMQPRT